MNFPYVLAEYLLSKAVFNLVQNSISLYESVNGLAVWSKSASNRGHPHKFQFIKKWAHTQYETGFLFDNSITLFKNDFLNQLHSENV